MSSENLLKKFSGINNLKAVFWGRLFIGLVFLIYGVLILNFISIEDIWTKWSIALAFLGLGLTFILDGQSALREYFTGSKISEIKNREANGLIISIIVLFFIIGTILFFIKFNNLENPSLYPMAIFLVAILIILIFQDKISHFELSKDKIIVKMKEGEEKDYEKIESKKKEWGFKIEEVNENVRQNKDKRI